MSILVLSLVLLSAPEPIDAFVYRAEALPVGSAFHYRKSNIDGSHASNVVLYVAAQDRIESLKWSEGHRAATLVKAEMDWDLFSVRRFETWRFSQGEGGQLRGWLEAGEESGTYHYSFGPFEGDSTVESAPWHSYDFDFASLNLSLRYLRELEGSFGFHIADAIPQGDSWVFGNVGAVTMSFEARETRGDREVRRYAIDGPGLDDRGGWIWVDIEDRIITDLEIEKPDEDEYQNNKLLLLETEQLTEAEWQELVASKWE
jgi:hypothetical protein